MLRRTDRRRSLDGYGPVGIAGTNVLDFVSFHGGGMLWFVAGGEFRLGLCHDVGEVGGVEHRLDRFVVAIAGESALDLHVWNSIFGALNDI